MLKFTAKDGKNVMEMADNGEIKITAEHLKMLEEMGNLPRTGGPVPATPPVLKKEDVEEEGEK